MVPPLPVFLAGLSTSATSTVLKKSFLWSASLSTGTPPVSAQVPASFLLATANSFKVPVAFTWGPAVALRDGVGVVGVVGVAGGELADSDVDGDGSDGLADGEAGTAMVDAPVGGTWPQPV